MRKVSVVCLLVFACLTYVSAQTLAPGSLVPTGKGYAVPSSHVPPTQQVHNHTVNQGNGIDYHGGPIMPNTVNVYYIWYGKWIKGAHKSDSPLTKSLLKTFGSSIGGTTFEQINTTYGDNNNNVTGNVAFGGATGMSYKYGKNLSDGNIAQIVGSAISSGKLPTDANGVYFVFTSSDVNESSGFCSFYCGWHTHGSINGQDLKYSFIGNPDRCSSSCEAQTNSPNGDSGADGIANIMSHELEESITDPETGSGWWQNSSGGENGDLCAWKWGTLLGGVVGNKGYNETFGGKNWLLQMDWENSRGGGCDNYLGGPFHSN